MPKNKKQKISTSDSFCLIASQMSYFSPVYQLQLPLSPNRSLPLVPCFVGMHHIVVFEYVPARVSYLSNSTVVGVVVVVGVLPSITLSFHVFAFAHLVFQRVPFVCVFWFDNKINHFKIVFPQPFPLT